MLNRLQPDQARHSVGLDLGPNCLQRLSAEDSKQANRLICHIHFYLPFNSVWYYNGFKYCGSLSVGYLNLHCFQNRIHTDAADKGFKITNSSAFAFVTLLLIG